MKKQVGDKRKLPFAPDLFFVWGSVHFYARSGWASMQYFFHIMMQNARLCVFLAANTKP